ncbi:MAG: polysaccharide deacetylase [Parvibaculaceae bacterium]|nr:polysaccharide deacetylase [Parvibaculaceae bacterium]
MIENPVPWPNGAKCAVAITFDIDTDSFLHLDFPERARSLVSTNSWLRYDEVAIPRIVKMYKDFGLKQTFFYPAWCMEQYPRLVETILEGGHEIAHHGYLHEGMNQLSDEDEVYWIERAIDTIVRMTGQRPRGFRAPLYNFSHRTADILAQQGFAYDASLMADDIPYRIKTASGSLWEVPSHWALDDWPPYVHNIDINFTMSIRSPEEAMGVFMAEFEAMYEYGGLWVAVWHPWVSGRLARCSRIAKMIEYMQTKDVWFASMEEIARHVQSVTDAGTYTPREVGLPYYDGPIDPASLPRLR